MRFICCLCFFLPLLAAAQTPAHPPALHPATPHARVVIAQDDAATDAFQPRPEKVHGLVQRGLTNLTGLVSATAAWRSLVSTQDTIGIKVFSAPGAGSGTRPAVVEAVVKSLLDAGLSPKKIIIWDKQWADLRRAGFVDLARRQGVRVAAATSSGWDEKIFYDSPYLGQLVYGDFEFNKKGETVGRKSFVTKLVTREMTKIISITPLLNHNTAGVCGHLYSLSLGSVDNTLRLEVDPTRLATAVPEIYALPPLGDRVVLNIVDALICQYRGEQVGRLHYSTALNQLRFSTDPVALDVLSLLELDQQRAQQGTGGAANTNCWQLYQNASLVEIGVSDPRQITVLRAKSADQ